MRFSTRTVGDRMHNAIKRVTVEDTDEDHLFRESTLSLYAQEKQKEIEHFEPYGFSSRVKKPTDASSGGGASGGASEKKKAEGLMIFTGGNRSHGVLILAGDRRYRLRGLKEGELALFDDQGQQVHFTRDGIVTSAPKGKKIVAQIMDDEKAPKAQSKNAAADGQGPQASAKSFATFTLTKDSLAVQHPAKITLGIGPAGGNATASLEMLPDKITYAVGGSSREITSGEIKDLAPKIQHNGG
jgi:phage gp45-like